MATNRFDKPIESEYISQYTPIPFEQLYAIGKANNERVDKAYQDLGNQFTKWSEFRSPSAVDTKRWYDLTVGAGQDVVNKLAANPDLIKTAEGRSLIQSFINTRPYNELSQLQQSREGLLQRQKVNQQLMLSGKYNPMWHDVDFTNYNTLDSGVFNDVAPLAYKSEVDLVKPYVDNLKPGFIRQEGAYDWRGVSSERTDQEIANNISAIYNTPEAQKHIQVLIQQGYTPEQANALFANRIYRAGREFAYEDRELNPLSKIYEEDRLDRLKRARARTGQQTAQKPFRLTESIATTGGDAFKLGTQAYIANKYRDQINSLTDQYNKAVESNDNLSANLFKEQLRKIYNESNSYTPNKLFNEIFKEYATDGKLTNIDLSNATNDILNRFAAPSPIASVNDLLQTTIPGITSETVTTPLGKYRVIANPRQLDLATDVISEIAGYKHVESGKNKFRDALKNGKLTNVILQQGGNILTLPVNKNGQVQPNSSQVITVAIPQSQLDALGITDADMVISGAKRIYDRSGKVSLSTEIKEGDKRKLPFQRYLEEGEYSSKYNYEGKVSYNVPTEDVYWQIELLNKLPDPQDKLNTEYLDQQAWKLSMTDAFRSELYPSTQQEAYGIGYSAGEEEK